MTWNEFLTNEIFLYSFRYSNQYSCYDETDENH